MSTRSQVIIKDESQEQWFYRHSDGYPEGNLPALFKFMTWVEENKIRRNVEQSCGWLVIIGAEEYKEFQYGNPFVPSEWKVGAYEVCPCKETHGDIEWLYTIDLEKNNIEIYKSYTDKAVKFDYEELKRYSGNWNELVEEHFY